LAALGTVAAASLLPAMATYPLIHVIAAFYVSLALFLYAGAGWTVSRIVSPQ
jgi:hypothetical protein